ncbi:type III restriction endonuclease [Spirochaetia bacterium]|nr:type III restriction endonuclease [Spirochaetia bacterium]
MELKQYQREVITILDQTLKNFKDPNHPYCQKWQTLFRNRVQIITKEEALSGSAFNPEAVRSMLNILILSFDSFRTQKKEGRNVYKENGNLINFTTAYQTNRQIKDADVTSLAQVLNNIRPLVVIDESHNAKTPLSEDMLENLNPSFIMELTATPKNNSNVISYVNAQTLKKDHMVKLPVIVYNNRDANDVITAAIDLQRKLESAAMEEEAETQNYIRPIVLFQAEPKTGTESVTFTKIKEKLVGFGLPAEQIAIKTADINELKDKDLLSRDCPVRFILTVNALKEGWDCPFAYVLAALANRTSNINVEQIIGRILRQPYTIAHKNPVLNMSYCLTAQSDFLNTLENILIGIKLAGFSKDDYRYKQEQIDEAANGKQPKESAKPDREFDELLESIKPKPQQGISEQSTTDSILNYAKTEEENYKKAVEQEGRAVADTRYNPGGFTLPEGDALNQYAINAIYTDVVKQIRIPQFYEKESAGIFDQTDDDTDKLVSFKSLLNGFRLSQEETKIGMDGTGAEIYKIDTPLWEVAEDEPKYMKLAERELDMFLKFVNTLSPEGQKTELLGRLMESFKHIRFDYLEESDLAGYIKRVIDNFSAEQLEQAKQNPYITASRVKAKIDSLSNHYAKRIFDEKLDTNCLFIKETWAFPKKITVMDAFSSLQNMLYTAEEKPNHFEHSVINAVSNLPTIRFWHRNIERKGFCLNGWINHYPDFIVYTQKGNLILLETKGDDRDNSDSAAKLDLGKKWAAAAGNKYKYFMVFENQEMAGAYKLADFLSAMKQL